jgi:CelD/BcsL family acetyltransferase involved in cellulose biosynthesis
MSGPAGRNGDLVLERVATLDTARTVWTDLAVGAANVFATWEWASTWWRHHGRADRLRVTVCRTADGAPVAVLPLYLWMTRPVRIARFIGHGPADQLGPVCREADRPTAAAGLVGALAEARCDVLVGEELHGDEGWPALLGVETDARAASPTLPIEWSTWDDFLGSRRKSVRTQLRRRERGLEKLGHGYRLADASRLEHDLDLLFRLHRARWGDASSPFARNEPFHREFATMAHDRGWLRLWFLEVDGEAVATLYCLRYAGIEWYYQAGRDPAWDRFSVGTVLLGHAVRTAIEDGVQEYRFGRGDESYKWGFATTDPGLERIILTRGAKGLAAVRAGRAARRVRRVVKAPRRFPGRSQEGAARTEPSSPSG